MFLMFKGCLFVRVNISFAAIVASLCDVVSVHTYRPTLNSCDAIYNQTDRRTHAHIIIISMRAQSEIQ